MKPKSSFRPRKCGTPVRTGCITCKIRRVKCGEEKPNCNRCSSTGRKCDGYLQILTAKSSNGSSPRWSLSPAPAVDLLEVEILSFFHAFTADSLSVNFSSEFWRRTVIQASDSEPSVRHGLIALGAIHRDFLDKRHNNGSNCEPIMPSFAVQQYTKAINHLQKLISNNQQQVVTTLISCILFITIDSFLGNYAAAIMHLKAGLQILENIKGQKTLVSSTLITNQQIGSILLGLGVQMASFITAQNSESPMMLLSILNPVIPSSAMTEFRSLDEARLSLDSLAVEIGGGRAGRISVLESSSLSRERDSRSLSAWTESMDRFLSRHSIRGPLPAPVGSVKYGATLLLIHFLIISFRAHTSDDVEQRFEKVISLCDRIFNVANSEIFAADVGIIAPLFYTATNAPQISMRQKALRFLSGLHGQEGLWNASDAIRIAITALYTD